MGNWRSAVVPAVASAATLTVLIGFFAAGFFMRGWLDQQRAAVASPPPAKPGERFVADISVDDDPYWGPENAQVTVVEFADFQCPFCQRHAEQTMAQLRETYGDRVRYVFRDFPIVQLHPQAFKAAVAAQCAFAQDGFWEFHERLFQNQHALAEDDLKQHAAALGLDAAAFDYCLESEVYTEEVQADLDDGIAYGVTGTPAFFINGRVVAGAAPFSVFEEIIEEELATAASR